jgi:oxygen-independent coproporphyrinogen-3 oxidase
VSTYPFIDFTYTSSRSKPLGRRSKRLMLDTILEVTADLGLERTSVWTFAESGTIRYSSVTRDSYRGFGPSAASLLGSSFSLNVFSVPEYIRSILSGTSPTSLVAELSARERRLFWLFWHAYNLRIEESSFVRQFGVSIESVFGHELRAGRLLGLLTAGDDGYRLTKRGAYLFHLVEQLYTDQYIDRIWRLGTARERPARLVIR